MRLLLALPAMCPYCGYEDLRETRRPLTGWERLLRLRRYRCQSCWRRLLAFRTVSGEPRDRRIYNRG